MHTANRQCRHSPFLQLPVLGRDTDVKGRELETLAGASPADFAHTGLFPDAVHDWQANSWFTSDGTAGKPIKEALEPEIENGVEAIAQDGEQMTALPSPEILEGGHLVQHSETHWEHHSSGTNWVLQHLDRARSGIESHSRSTVHHESGTNGDGRCAWVALGNKFGVV
jgi:hypothetical protein